MRNLPGDGGESAAAAALGAEMRGVLHELRAQSDARKGAAKVLPRGGQQAGVRVGGAPRRKESSR